MNIEKKRKMVEKAKVSAARDEMELNIMETLARVDNLKLNVENQEKRIRELEIEIKNMED
jgi:hypothetical protein